MSESRTSTISFGGLWLVAFLVLKLGGTKLAFWSWWWILLPIVPVVVVICQRFGLI